MRNGEPLVEVFFWRTITQILCGECLKYRNSAVLCRLFGNSEITCCRCGVKAERQSYAYKHSVSVADAPVGLV